MSTIIRAKLLLLQWKSTQTYDNTPIHNTCSRADWHRRRAAWGKSLVC